MSYWRRLTGNIKREVSAQGVGWLLTGGLVTRQLKTGVVLLLPAIAAMLILTDGLLKQVVVGTLVVGWFLVGFVLYGIGTFFLSKKMDRYYDRKVRPKLSKEYRKP
jgi:hypothetical protein